MFEPIGGTAPAWTGKNAINPLAAIGAGAMMLESLGEKAAAAAIEKSIIKSLNCGKIKGLAAGKMGLSTTQVGDLVAENV
jgi:3-isopropylmalate dehydrogenase